MIKTKTFIIILLLAFCTILFSGNTNLNKKEIQWLSEHKTIRIAPDPNFPPIEYFNEQGNYVGIAADYMKLIEEDLGIQFEVVHCKNWDEVLQKARDREVDLLPAAAQTPQRAKYMLFSSPHLIFPGIIITRNDYGKIRSIKQLYNKKVAVVSGYVWQDFLVLHHPEIEIIPVNSVVEGLRDVSTGAIDIMIGTFPVVLYYIEEEGIHNLQIAGETGYYTKLSVISRKDWPILNSIIEKSLKNISLKKKEAINKKWISIKRKSIFETRIFWIIVISILAISIFIIMFIYIWNRILKKQVNKKTIELQQDIVKREKAEKELAKHRDHLEDLVKERTKELEKVHDQLIRKERLAVLGQLSSGVAHELRNPLGVISNSIYYLNMKLKDKDEKVKKHLALLKREIKRSDNMIIELLDFSKVKLLNITETNVNTLIKETIEEIKIPEHIDLEMDLDEKIPQLQLDPDKMQLVIQDIISNALQAMPEKGKLHIKTSSNDDFTEISFGDNGSGITEENLKKMFEPLFTTRAKGIGLGLSIVKNIIDYHKGKIDVKSEVGKGTTFTIKLRNYEIEKLRNSKVQKFRSYGNKNLINHVIPKLVPRTSYPVHPETRNPQSATRKLKGEKSE